VCIFVDLYFLTNKTKVDEFKISYILGEKKLIQKKIKIGFMRTIKPISTRIVLRSVTQEEVWYTWANYTTWQEPISIQAQH